jgi:hypothetical protein
MRNENNRVFFGAFTRCYQEARGGCIYSTGSDGQWSPENLEPMLDGLEVGVVVGVRNNRCEVYTLRRRVISYSFNKLPRILFGVAVHDAGSVKLGVSEIFRFELISKSPFFEAERVIKAVRLGYKLDSVPIRFLSRSDGRGEPAAVGKISTIRCGICSAVSWFTGPGDVVIGCVQENPSHPVGGGYRLRLLSHFWCLGAH